MELFTSMRNSESPLLVSSKLSRSWSSVSEISSSAILICVYVFIKNKKIDFISLATATTQNFPTLSTRQFNASTTEIFVHFAIIMNTKFIVRKNPRGKNLWCEALRIQREQTPCNYSIISFSFRVRQMNALHTMHTSHTRKFLKNSPHNEESWRFVERSVWVCNCA